MKILITGANGMIASCIVDVLNYLNETENYNVKIYIMVRDKNKILSRFIGTGATEALQEGTEQYLESLSDIIFLGSDEQGNKSVGEMFVKDGKLNTKMLESAAYAASVGFFTGGGFGVMGTSDPQTREMRSLMAFRSELNEQSKTSNEYK